MQPIPLCRRKCLPERREDPQRPGAVHTAACTRFATTVDGNPHIALLTLPNTLAAGTSIELEIDAIPCLPDAKVTARYTITEPAALPSKLGTLNVTIARDEITVNTSNGSCTTAVYAAYADFSVALAEAAQPLADVIDYSLFIDGEFHAGTPQVGPNRGKARVYTACPAEPGLSSLAEGTHRARMVGTLSGGAAKLETDEVSFELRCKDGRHGSTADAGVAETARNSSCSVHAPMGRNATFDAWRMLLACVLIPLARRRWRRS